MELFQLFGKIAIDNTEANKAINDSTNEAKKGESEQSKAFQAIGNTAKTVGKGIMTAWSAIKNVFSGWGSFFSGLWTSIKNKFGSIGSSIGSTMGNAVKSGMNAVIRTVESTINKGINLINSAIKLANKLPGINVGTVPKLSLPRLAQGGILKKGQIGFLEGTGAEAVVPLEKNTEWIDRVVEQMNKRSGTYDIQPIISRLNQIIIQIEELLGMNIYLDSGVLVGELAPAIDQKLGNISIKKLRRNT